MASQSSTRSKAQAKAELKKLREQQKAQKQQAKAARKAKKASGEGVFSRIKQVFNMTRSYDPKILWWMLLVAVLVFTVIFVLLNFIIHWIVALILALPFALLGAMITMNRRAEKAAFARIEGRPGAAAAALGTLRRGWAVTEEPVAMDPKTQDAVFRVTGKPGVVLVTEGPKGRVKKLVGKTQKQLRPVLRNEVPIHIVQSGRGEGQVPLPKLTKHIKKLDKSLNKHEIQEVERRLSTLPIGKPPIPKGVDPWRARPDRKALRG
ncbi:DUF4191 domain-containing protein [Nesterenkonia sp. MY13]|uniref:DUF4191 domain-containing protein n=1 Tax=Nesterenkonia sedimenti TaxID=1463632 RepID=A0A7X8YCV6_9MICC|nr:DUF4191 domain-containing protein [Nesterenkonia sedimenti]NLS08726.1 DUF4191 domain-containing protein [Nesterenkonia sedimenti]